jgi:hypothetical protein
VEQKQGEEAHRETEIDKEIQRMYGHVCGSNRKDSVMLFASNSRHKYKYCYDKEMVGGEIVVIT